MLSQFEAQLGCLEGDMHDGLARKMILKSDLIGYKADLKRDKGGT